MIDNKYLSASHSQSFLALSKVLMTHPACLNFTRDVQLRQELVRTDEKALNLWFSFV
jgi:hypothetical protein